MVVGLTWEGVCGDDDDYGVRGGVSDDGGYDGDGTCDEKKKIVYPNDEVV